MPKLIAIIWTLLIKRSALMILVALPCLLASCTMAPARSHSLCTVRQIDMVVRDAAAHAGGTFCGEVYAVEHGRTARILSGPGEIPPSNDLAILVASRTRNLLVGLSTAPHRFYVEARIDPMVECFSPSASGEDCSPYRRPVVFHISLAQRRR